MTNRAVELSTSHVSVQAMMVFPVSRWQCTPSKVKTTSAVIEKVALKLSGSPWLLTWVAVKDPFPFTVAVPRDQ
jgi:hypothetical protein